MTKENENMDENEIVEKEKITELRLSFLEDGSFPEKFIVSMMPWEVFKQALSDSGTLEDGREAAGVIVNQYGISFAVEATQEEIEKHNQLNEEENKENGENV